MTDRKFATLAWFTIFTMMLLLTASAFTSGGVLNVILGIFGAVISVICLKLGFDMCEISDNAYDGVKNIIERDLEGGDSNEKFSQTNNNLDDQTCIGDLDWNWSNRSWSDSDIFSESDSESDDIGTKS